MTLLTAKETREMLRISKPTLTKLTKAGLPVIKLGRSLRYNQDQIAEYLESNTQAAI